MDSSELQSLTSNGSTPDTSSLLNSVMPIIQIASILGIILTIIIIIYFIVNIVQKQREHAAIMRIDKNLQKLVDSYGQNAKPDPIQDPVAAKPKEDEEEPTVSS